MPSFFLGQFFQLLLHELFRTMNAVHIGHWRALWKMCIASVENDFGYCSISRKPSIELRPMKNSLKYTLVASKVKEKTIPVSLCFPHHLVRYHDPCGHPLHIKDICTVDRFDNISLNICHDEDRSSRVCWPRLRSACVSSRLEICSVLQDDSDSKMPNIPSKTSQPFV